MLFQRPDPAVARSVRGMNWGQAAVNNLPMPVGRVSAVARKALAPESIRAGARAFEAEMAQYQAAQKRMIVQEMLKRKALAARAQAQASFKKVWPDGMSEKLLSNYINKKR